MRAGKTLIIALAVLMTAGCALSRAQDTEPRRVVVMKFKGSKAKKLQALVEDLVGKHHKVVSDKRYRKTARKLKARRMRPRHVKKVATELGLDAVVEGKLVRRSRRKYMLRIQVREGATGKTIENYSIPVRKRRMSGDNKRKLERKLVDLLDEIEPIEEPEVDDEDEAEPDRKRKRKRLTKRDKKRKRLAKRDKKRKRLAKRDRDRDRKRAKKRKKRERRLRIAEAEEPEDDFEPFEIVDKVDENGQFLDDEVPANLK